MDSRQIYPKEVIERCVGESHSWKEKIRRVRQSTMLSLVWFVISMALWSRLRQCLVWEKLVRHYRRYPSRGTRCPIECIGSSVGDEPSWDTQDFRH